MQRTCIHIDHPIADANRSYSDTHRGYSYSHYESYNYTSTYTYGYKYPYYNSNTAYWRTTVTDANTDFYSDIYT
jgi:hypothetical protein